MSLIDPRTIYVAIPCYDGKLMSELAGQLINGSRMFGAISLPTECSHIALQRNMIAASFLASSFEWLVCIDSDNVPTGLRDLQLLLEPCDTAVRYVDPESTDTDADARPSRIVTGLSDSLEHLDLKTGAAADILVTAEYSYKDDALRPCRFGLGFTRVHRSVFERLMALQHDGGPTVEVRRDVFERLKNLKNEPGTGNFVTYAQLAEDLIDELIGTAEDKAGQPRLWRISHQGRLLYDFYPSGALVSQFVPNANWMGEDYGFFTLCQLAGIIPRIETRTRLLHIGRKAYPYFGPEVGAGQ
jgi:hypothetical protein